MSVPTVVGFGLAVLPVCLTPGVSFALVTQRVAARGRRAGAGVVAGTAAGLVCHATLAALGLAALVMRSAEAFTAVKLAGAAYLIWLGVTLLWRARKRPAEADLPTHTLPWSGRSDVMQGFLGNVLNPKAAAVYLTLAPQFLRPGEAIVPQMAELVAVHIVVAGTWLMVWSAFVDCARVVLTRERIRRRVDRLTGSVMIALGLRTAVAR